MGCMDSSQELGANGKAHCRASTSRRRPRSNLMGLFLLQFSRNQYLLIAQQCKKGGTAISWHREQRPTIA